MRPIRDTIDKIEDWLGHSPHPAIVALPIGTWVFSNICDVLGMATGERKYDDAARLSMGVGLIGAAASVVTGLRDYSYIPKERPSHETATKHALGNAMVGTLFASSYIIRMQDEQAGRCPRLAARMLALAGGSLALYTAWLGGVMVEEQGEGVKAVSHRDDQQVHRVRERMASQSAMTH